MARSVSVNKKKSFYCIFVTNICVPLGLYFGFVVLFYFHFNLFFPTPPPRVQATTARITEIHWIKILSFRYVFGNFELLIPTDVP